MSQQETPKVVPKPGAVPESIKTEPWSGLEKESYSFIDDDFPHEKLLTLKTAQKSKNSTIKLKNTLNKKGDALKIAEDVKFWFNVRDNRQVYIRVK